MWRTSRVKPPWVFPIFAALIGGAMTAGAQDGLFVSKQLTPKNEYTFQIEGPAVDGAGNLYVGNLAIKDDPNTGGAIGRVKAGETKSTLFAPLPVTKVGTKLVKSKGSGIRFDRDGRMYVADFNNHNIFVFEPGQSKPKLYFHGSFSQPNDLAIAKDGTLYASDPAGDTGRIWRIARGQDGTVHGEVMTGRSMGHVNGLDLSPDDKTLYVNETNTGDIWSYRIDGTKLADAHKVISFGHKPPEFDLDGMRTDVTGQLYVTQNGAGQIVILTMQDNAPPKIKTVSTRGKNPSNLTFGGPDGKTVFVTQADGKFIESFRVDKPGREPCMQFGGAFCGP